MIGKIAKDVRTALHVKQEEFAYKLGISREYYSKIENGKVTPNSELTLSIIDAIRHFLVSQSSDASKDRVFEGVLSICLILSDQQRRLLIDQLAASFTTM